MSVPSDPVPSDPIQLWVRPTEVELVSSIEEFYEYASTIPTMWTALALIEKMMQDIHQLRLGVPRHSPPELSKILENVEGFSEVILRNLQRSYNTRQELNRDAEAHLQKFYDMIKQKIIDIEAITGGLCIDGITVHISHQDASKNLLQLLYEVRCKNYALIKEHKNTDETDEPFIWPQFDKHIIRQKIAECLKPA